MWAWWVVGVAWACVLAPTHVSACSCLFVHPQQHVCEADFVVMARVRRVSETMDGLVAYKVRVKRLLKASEKVELGLQKGLIYTSKGTCESQLASRTTYVLTGNVEAGKPWINLCHFAQPWKTLSPKQKKGFRLLYQSGCDCPIMSCHYWQSCPRASFLCAWETSRLPEDCQAKHAVCLRGADGSCGWLGGRLYRKCMKPHLNTTTDDGLHDNTVSDNTVRDNTVRDNTVRDNTVNDNTVRDNTVNAAQGNRNDVQDNVIHDNRVSSENDSVPPLPTKHKWGRIGYHRGPGRYGGPGRFLRRPLKGPEGALRRRRGGIGRRPMRRRPQPRNTHAIGYVPK